MADLSGLRTQRVVALPDIFIDILVPVDAWADTRRALDAIAARGGGNLPVGRTDIRLGGNALNLARAVAALGTHAELIAETDALGHALLQDRAAVPLGTGHVRRGSAAVTVALECRDANLMLSDSGPVHGFRPTSLTEEDRAALRGADAVAVLNWAQTHDGTGLLQEVARAAPDAFLYLDTGDPRRREADIPGLLAAVPEVGVDAWSMNENEALAFGGGESPLESARALASRTGVRIDLHTRRMAASIGDDETVVEAEDATARRTTGAGDHWNAGNLAGYLLGLDAGERLRLAHRVATAFVTNADGHPPTPDELGGV